MIPSSNHGEGQTNWIKFIPFVCPSQVHASPPTPPASATIKQHVDGQTNWIKFSYLSVSRMSTLHRRHRRPQASATIEQQVDGQTNSIKIITFVCPSHVHSSEMI